MMPQFNRTNIIAALVIGLFSAGVLACQLYAPEWPKETAIIALFIVVVAGVLHIPLSAVVAPPMVNVEHTDTMTTNVTNNPQGDPPTLPATVEPPITEADPIPSDRPAVVSRPRTVK